MVSSKKDAANQLGRQPKPRLHRLKKTGAAAKAGYIKAMPNKKSHRVLVWLIFIIISSVISAQLIYPADRSLPFTRIHGRIAQFKTHEDLAGILLKDFEKTKIEIVTNEGGRKKFLLREAGAELKTEHLVIKTQDYSVWQRLIPFTIFWQRPNINEAEVFFYQDVLKDFSDRVNEELTTKPKNATIAIKNGQLIAESDQSGSEVKAKQIREALIRIRPKLGGTSKVVVKTHPKKAEVTSQQFAAVKNQAESALAKMPIFRYENKSFSPTKKELASWLQLNRNAKNDVKLMISKKNLSKYIAWLNGRIGVQAGVTTINIVNGREVSRVSGKAGRAIVESDFTDKIERFLLGNEASSEIQVLMQTLQPTVTYSRRYTSSQAGLQAYLNDISGSQDVRVSVRQIGGSGWSASARGGESTVSASTYKLYVALTLFNKMDQGKIKWTDKMLDTTVSGCFDRMIIASTNQCSETWLAQWGRGSVNNFIWSRGFSSGTDFTNSLATHTTANDLTNFMMGLESGSLLSGSHRSRLLSGLSSHSYKNGIPSGSSASTIYNKVGFLWDYSNDTAIVRHPRGTYVISVMTKGSGFWKIAEITREVEKIIYP